MAKVVFMFPGVGSHYSGMGKYIYDNFPIARQTFEEASDALGIDMASLCMDKSRTAELNALENSQTALVTVSMASYRVFQQEIGLLPDATLGYSLGEYSALCAAGAIELSDVLKLVHMRGVIVREHASTVGGMAWVTNLAPEVVEQICAEVAAAGEDVFVSAYDTPQKTSISGMSAAIRLAGEKVVEHGGIVIPLKMTGPFHSPLMQPAAERYREYLKGFKFRAPTIPVIANRNGAHYENAESVLDNLYLQLVQPVRWLDSLRCLIREGMTIAVEMGPKDVLKYLLQAVSPGMLICNFDKEKDIRKTVQTLVVQESEYGDIISGCLAVVAGTKNRNRDNDLTRYEQCVVLPFRRIQARFEEIIASGQSPDLDFVAIRMMLTALEAKHIRAEERGRYLRELLNGKVLPNFFY